MSITHERRTRAEAYGSKQFAGEIAEILQRSRKEVSLHIEALLGAQRIPIEAPEYTAEWAASQEAARILAAIGSRQVNPGSLNG
jgi:hypothetical protein